MTCEMPKCLFKTKGPSYQAGMFIFIFVIFQSHLYTFISLSKYVCKVIVSKICSLVLDFSKFAQHRKKFIRSLPFCPIFFLSISQDEQYEIIRSFA